MALIHVLLAFAVMACLTSLGLKFLRPAYVDSFGVRALIGWALGCAVFIATLFLLALFGWLSFWPVVIFLALTFPLRPSQLLKNLEWSGPPAGAWRSEPLYVKALLAIVAAIAVFSFVFGYAPPTQMDELNYQLLLPKVFAWTSELTSWKDNLCSYYPLNGQLLYTAFMLIGGEMAVKALVWVLGVMTLGFTWVLSRRLLGFDRAGATVALLFYAAPVFISFQGVTNTDFLAVLLLLSTVAALHTWRSSGRMADLLLAGLFSGVALGARNYSAAWIAAITLVMLWETKSLKALLYPAVAALVFSPWPLRNWMLTGNPIYPQKLFGDFDPYFAMHVGYLTAPDIFKAILNLPGFLAYGNLINGAGLVLVTLVFWTAINPSPKPLRQYIWIFLINSVLLLFFPFVNPRYFGHVYPLVAMAAAYGAQGLLKQYPGLFGRFIKLWIVGVGALPGLLLAGYWGGKRVPYFIGTESKPAYLSREYEILSDYAMIEHMRAAVQPGSKILALFFLSPSYYFYPDYVMVTVNRYPPALFQGPAEELAAQLRKDGVRYVLFPKNEIESAGGTWTMRAIGFEIRELPAGLFTRAHETPGAILFEVRNGVDGI